MKGWEELTIEKIRTVLEMLPKEEQPYKSLGYGLYELPGNVICNKKGLNEYLNICLKIKFNE